MALLLLPFGVCGEQGPQVIRCVLENCLAQEGDLSFHQASRSSSVCGLQKKVKDLESLEPSKYGGLSSMVNHSASLCQP